MPRETVIDTRLLVLQERILAMARQVESALNDAMRALEQREWSLSRSVVDGDRHIDMAEVEIDDACMELLTDGSLTPEDVRLVAMVFKINGELERMGDLAVGMAHRAADLLREPPLPLPSGLASMAAVARSMVRDSLDAFVRRDADAARSVCARDDEVDRLNGHVFSEMLSRMMSEPNTISRSIPIVIIARGLERVADHATNIAEDVVYVVDGTSIKHHAEKGGKVKARRG